MDIARNFVVGSDSFFDVVERSRMGSFLLNLSLASDFRVVSGDVMDIKGWNYHHPDRPITDPYRNLIRFTINNKAYYSTTFDIENSAFSFVIDFLNVEVEEG